MELTESIESMNRYLADIYGIDTITGLPIWRIVWSEDQFEKRKIDTTESGILLPYPIVREVPKYRQWVQEKYVLERLVIVPEMNRDELPANKISYEPLFVFQGQNGKYLPPKMEVCELVIDTVMAAQGKGSLAKYLDPASDEKDPAVARAKQRARVDEIVSDLFGNESDVGDSLAYHEGIVVPRNYTKES